MSVTMQYLLKASMASNGVITGEKNSLLSKRAVWAQETVMKTSHCHKWKRVKIDPNNFSEKEAFNHHTCIKFTSGKLASFAGFGLPITRV